MGLFPSGLPVFSPSVKIANTHGIPPIDIGLTNHADTNFEQNLMVLQGSCVEAVEQVESRKQTSEVGETSDVCFLIG